MSLPRVLHPFAAPAREAGACGIWANLLHLQPGTREHFLACLARDWPELLPRYEQLYRRGAYLPADYREMLRERAAPLISRHGLASDMRSFTPAPADTPVSAPVHPTLF